MLVSIFSCSPKLQFFIGHSIANCELSTFNDKLQLAAPIAAERDERIAAFQYRLHIDPFFDAVQTRA